MLNILYLPTRYFPSISGAEFYLQRMAEIFTKSYNYNVDVLTSNAIDFKALRDPKGRTIKSGDKYYNKINNLEIKRYPIEHNVDLNTQISKLKDIDAISSLNLSDACLKEIIKNGPYLINLIEDLMNNNDMNYDIIHSTFFPYFNLLIGLAMGKIINKPTI